jgi:uncharacterized protein YcbK (DUF882 family)
MLLIGAEDQEETALTLLHRRQAIRAGLAMAGLALAGRAPAMAALPSLGPRALSLDNLHTGEKLNAVYWDGGAYVPDALAAINQVLRDFRTGDVHPIAPPLLDLLVTLRGQLGTRGPFEVISGYRSPATNAMLAHEGGGVASKSFHMKGMAIDIRLPDTALAHLHDAALSLGRGGVGYYPHSDFVHVDVGPVRRWGG